MSHHLGIDVKSESSTGIHIPGLELVDPAHLGDPEALIASAHAQKDFRPIVLPMVRNENGEVLLVKSAKGSGEWGPVQGGIEEGEDLRRGAHRELGEEAGIAEHDVTIGAVTHIARIRAHTGRAPKDGFRHGGLYLAVSALYRGNGDLSPDPKEVSDAVWTPQHRVLEYLKGKRPQKAHFIQLALASS